MARQECDYYDSIKTFSVTKTTSSVGTFGVGTLPSDCHAIVGLKTASVSSAFYCVQYNSETFGFFGYAPPHEPCANTLVTAEFFYI